MSTKSDVCLEGSFSMFELKEMRSFAQHILYKLDIYDCIVVHHYAGNIGHIRYTIEIIDNI